MNVELLREPSKWFNDRCELAAFCRWMEEMGRAPLDRWELVQLAERYDAEHEEFVRWDALERDADEQADERHAL